MPFPAHPRPGTLSPTKIHPIDSECEQKQCQQENNLPGRNILFASLSIALAIALVLILVLNMEIFGGEKLPFAEVHLQVDGQQITMFGRRLPTLGGEAFLDIPYAVNTPRFQQAELATPPSDFYAIHHGNGCPNGFTRTRPYPDINWNPPPLEGFTPSEQCLSLNVYRCAETSSQQQLLPVLVFVPEGNWLKRSNGNLELGSVIRRLACNREGGAEGMVVVALNYRMGPFGHFHAPGWPESKQNFALWDIRAGLEWVQRHIVAFGGHKGHVTVMARGESARLVSLLSALPQGQGLFKRQILLSGSAFSPSLILPESTPVESEETGFNPSMHFAIAAGCVNEREWQALEANNGSADVLAKLEACLAAMSAEAIIAAEARVRAPSMMRWPLTAQNNSGTPNFNLPARPFESGIPSISTVFGICSNPVESKEKDDKKPGMAESISKRLAEAIREELAQRLGQMQEFGRGEVAAAVKRHYLEAFGDEQLQQMDGEGELDGLVEKIRSDFLISGPILLEALARARLAESRVYGFTFVPPGGLNMSTVDVAERAARQTNPWTSAQPPCVDDLLLNPAIRGMPELDRLAGEFAARVASFVAFGDPNPEDEATTTSTIPQWPIVFPRKSASSMATMDKLEPPKWLRLEAAGSQLEQQWPTIGDAHFWPCQMAKRLGLGPICVESEEKSG